MKYVTKMKNTFDMLQNYSVPLYEEDKITQISENNCPNNNLKTVVNIYLAMDYGLKTGCRIL